MAEMAMAYMIIGVLAISYRLGQVKEFVTYCFDMADEDAGLESTPLMRTVALCAGVAIAACAWPVVLIRPSGGGPDHE